MLKKLIFVLSILLLLSNPILAQSFIEGYLPQVKEIVSKAEEMFPKLKGYIIDVDKDKVLMDLGVESKLRIGMELYVYREGKEIIHPITGAVLGKMEEKIGNVKVIDIKTNYSVGKIISLEPGKKIQKGDRVKISAIRIRIIIPLLDNEEDKRFDAEAFTNALVMGFKSSNRFEIIPSGDFLSALDSLGFTMTDIKRDKEKLLLLGKKLKAKAIIFTKLSKLKHLKGERIVNVKLVSLETGDEIAKLSVKVKEYKKIVAFPTIYNPLFGGYRESGGFLIKSPTFSDENLTLSQELPFEIRAIGFGDVNKDGKNEIIVSDGKRIIVFKWINSALKKIWTEEGSSINNHLTIDVADINKNGIPEIFVTNYTSPFLNSYVIEYKDGKFKKIAQGYRYYFRVLYAYDKTDKPILIGQSMGMDRAFSGPIYKFVYKNGKYKKDKALNLPDNINIYGFTIYDLNNDGKKEIVMIDDSNKLRIYNEKGKKKWVSDERYGGYDTYIDIIVKNDVFSIAEDREIPGNMEGSRLKRIRIKGRILVKDSMIDENQKEVIVAQNNPGITKFLKETKFYKNGCIIGLSWSGFGLHEVWRTKKLDAYIADFCFGDIDNDGSDELIIGLVKKAFFGKILGSNTSRIAFYKIE